jgi:hypothetical protein
MMRKRRLKVIISEIAFNSRVIDAESGDFIDGVLSVNIESDPNDRSGVSTVTIKLAMMKNLGCLVEIEGQDAVKALEEKASEG